MKKNKILLLSLISFLTVTACSNTSPSGLTKKDETNIASADRVIDVTFDNFDLSKFKINKFIYGTFIEFIEDCIYGGIWAEKVLDRKFYTPIGEGVSAWALEKGNLSAATGNDAFQQDYSPTLSSGAEIYQTYFTVMEAEDYTGYLWAKGNGDLKISMTQGTNEKVSTIVHVNSNDYEKYTYAFTYPELSKSSVYHISCESGEVTFDSVSLMPANNYHGMRIDTLEALKELNSTFYRYPGGNFVSGYDFYDGIGDIDKRPTVLNRHYCSIYDYYEGDTDEDAIGRALQAIGQNGWYGAFDPNDFGIDEFMVFCKYLNTEPNIVVNSGLGSAQMAADEVEFCNGSSNSTWGSKRATKEPYNVKIWGVGNEMYGESWQLGYVPLNQYTKRHNQFAEAMKAVDPNIELIGVGAGTSWSQAMLNECRNNMDYLSIHWYPKRDETSVRGNILSMKECCESSIKEYRSLSNNEGITLAIDEYAFALAEEPSRLKDGMAVAAALNSMIQNGDIVDIACYSSTVNAVQGNVKATKLDAYMEGSGYAISLYRDNMQDYYLPVKYKKLKDVEYYYEIFTTINKEQTQLTVSVINATEETLCIKSDQFKKPVKVDYMQGDYFYGNNTDTRTELHRYKEDFEGLSKTFTVEPRSIALVTVDI